jgi:23S rRNA pseudouridine2605 synthase
LLARAGIASRREIERMIAEGRIALNGVALDTPATLLTSLHGVTVDGHPVKAPAPARLFRFHKPAGLLTAERDPKGRRTIYDVLPKGLPRVMPVGRLDLNTEGLLLLTTDGGLKRELELPATGVERTYRARAFGDISQERLEQLFDGIEIDGIRYGPIDANLERRTGRNQWIEMKLREGKNREVRRVLEHLGLQVSRLIRTAYGPFELADLPAGAVDEIRQHDLVAFRKTLQGGGAGERNGDGARVRSRTVQRPPQFRDGPRSARTDRKPQPRDDAGGARPVRPSRPKDEGRKAAAGKPSGPRDRGRGAKAGPAAKPDGNFQGRKPARRPAPSRPGAPTRRGPRT